MRRDMVILSIAVYERIKPPRKTSRMAGRHTPNKSPASGHAREENWLGGLAYYAGRTSSPQLLPVVQMSSRETVSDG